jgi:hypothetical protein
VVGVDLAYCIAASSSSQLISSDGASEATLLSFYLDCLVEHLVRLDVYDTEADAREAAPFAVLRRQYDTAFLDLARVVIAEHWGTLTLEQLKHREGKMSFNAYNKSSAHVAWFIARVVAVLQKEEWNGV